QVRNKISPRRLFPLYSGSRDQHLSALQPGTCIHNQITHVPVLIVEIDVHHVSECTIAAMDFGAFDLFCGDKHVNRGCVPTTLPDPPLRGWFDVTDTI